MNILRVITKQQEPGAFTTYWTNTTLKPYAQRGAIRIKVNSADPDGGIIAELHALRYLLEKEEAVGENRAGDENLILIVSFGAIRKLSRMDSQKASLAEHAKFLTTRFKGSQIKVEKEEAWIDKDAEPSITLDASIIDDEALTIPAIGEVALTAHVVDQFATRFGIDSSGEAWRKLLKIATDDRLKELDRQTAGMKLKYAIQGKELGRYFYNPAHQAMLIVVEDKKRQKNVLVTAYKLQPELA